jgi:hypothetical protein
VNAYEGLKKIAEVEVDGTSPYRHNELKRINQFLEQGWKLLAIHYRGRDSGETRNAIGVTA